MSYAGGKNGSGVYQRIINLMPPHSVYVEAFLGGGAIMRIKRPAAVNVGIEANRDVIETLWTPAPMPTLQVHHDDALNFLQSIWLAQFDADEVLIYADPPYLMSVRSCQQRIYQNEFHTEAEHSELLKILKRLPQKVMISGYDSPLYNRLLKGWRKEQFTGVTRGGPRTETVWLNFPEPTELHDYRFLGDDRRERQDIKRQKDRWLAKLANMPAQRRYAMFAAIEDFKRSCAVESAVIVDDGENTGEISSEIFTPAGDGDPAAGRTNYAKTDHLPRRQYDASCL